MSEVSRRNFMKLAGAGGLGLAVFGLTGCQEPAYPLIEVLASEYLARHPEEASQAVLAPMLGNPAANAWISGMLKNLARQIDTDYATSNTESITGWRLSKTEWRIAAHWSLRPPPTTTTTVP